MQAERFVGHCVVLKGHSPSRMLPLLRSLQIIIIIQKKTSENNPAIFAFTLLMAKLMCSEVVPLLWLLWCGGGPLSSPTVSGC